MSLRGLLALALLGTTACAREEAWTWTTPAVVGESELMTELRPRGGESLVLAHFWATW